MKFDISEYWSKVAALRDADEQRIAPVGMVWICGACGKTAIDRYGLVGQSSVGWDESCMLNAMLTAATKTETEE